MLATLSGQCAGIIINANGDPERFADTGVEVVRRQRAGLRRAARRHPGRARLGWRRKRNGVEWLVSVPGDCPFLPDDLVERLHEARREMGAGMPLACARSGEWRHPVVGLWPLALREDLRKALVDEGLRKIEIWTARHGVRHRRLAGPSRSIRSSTSIRRRTPRRQELASI